VRTNSSLQVSDNPKLAIASFLLAPIMCSYAVRSLNTDRDQVSFDELKSHDTREVRRSWAGLGICAFIFVAIPVIGSARKWNGVWEISNLLVW
jgi:hypothetical protein